MEHLQLELSPPRSSRVPALPRVDLYGGVHRGLRYAHGKVLALLATLNYGERASVERTLDELEAVLELGAEHLALEERHYHPALEARKPEASARLAEQHRGHTEAFAELAELAARLSVASPDAAPALGRALYLRYASFVAEDLAHMAEEELVTLPLFHLLYSEEELDALQTELVRSIPPRARSDFFRLIILASSHPTRVTMLTRVRAELPAPAFSAMTESLRGDLAERDYLELMAAL
jgi:hypothetical protein